MQKKMIESGPENRQMNKERDTQGIKYKFENGGLCDENEKYV